MKSKLNNLISLDDFKANWKAEQAKKTKRTETGLDILKENIEEIIPEGPENEPEIGMSPESKIEKIRELIEDSDEGCVEEVVNYLREVLLDMEHQGSIDETTTDELDQSYDDWKEWINAVVGLEEIPEDALNGVIEICNAGGTGEEEFGEEPGPGVNGSYRLANLDDDDIEAIESDPITSEWLEDNRISIVDNELWIAEDDDEVIDYFEEHYGFEYEQDMEDMDEFPDTEDNEDIEGIEDIKPDKDEE